MPLYEYECDACGKRFEVIQKFSDTSVDTCTACGKGPVRRLPSSPAIQFKGTGWYITDYAQKQKATSEAKTESGEKSESGKTDDTKKTDTAAKGDSTAPTSSTTPKE